MSDNIISINKPKFYNLKLDNFIDDSNTTYYKSVSNTKITEEYLSSNNINIDELNLIKNDFIKEKVKFNSSNDKNNTSKKIDNKLNLIENRINFLKNDLLHSKILTNEKDFLGKIKNLKIKHAHQKLKTEINTWYLDNKFEIDNIFYNCIHFYSQKKIYFKEKIEIIYNQFVEMLFCYHKYYYF